MRTTNKRYETPQAEVIEIECQGVLCASGEAPTPTPTGAGAGGGTTNMNVQDGYGW
jgi:hypothetical protein